MRHISRRFPNGVTVHVEKHSGGAKFYTATKNGRKLGFYRVDNKRHRISWGKLAGKKFIDFYGWLRAARGAGSA